MAVAEQLEALGPAWRKAIAAGEESLPALQPLRAACNRVAAAIDDLAAPIDEVLETLGEAARSTPARVRKAHVAAIFDANINVPTELQPYYDAVAALLAAADEGGKR